MSNTENKTAEQIAETMFEYWKANPNLGSNLECAEIILKEHLPSSHIAEKRVSEMDIEQAIIDYDCKGALNTESDKFVVNRLKSCYLEGIRKGLSLVQPSTEKDKWISVEERLPVEIKEDGKRFSKWVFAYNKKARNKAIYYPTKFEVCQWDDLDIDELPDCVEAIDEEFYLKEGWYNEFEHNGDLMQVPMYNVTHWQPLPESPPTK